MSNEDKQENNSKKTDVWTYHQIVQRIGEEMRFGKNYNSKHGGSQDDKYFKKAEELMFRIPLYVPTPIFEVDVQDLSIELRKQLVTSPDEEIKKWVKSAIGKLFDESNPAYYRGSVHKLLHVKLTNSNPEEKIHIMRDKIDIEVNQTLVDCVSPEKFIQTFEETEFLRLTRLAAQHKILSKDNMSDIDFILDTVTKEAKNEHRLTLQIMLVLFSTYTQNPLNLAINAPSGEGKSYVLHKISSLFPNKDIEQITGMTEKSIFHQKGKNTYINPHTNKEEDADEIVANLKSQKSSLERKKRQAIDTKDGEEETILDQDIRDIDAQIDEIKANVKKIIDLRHKVLVFLDTPDQKMSELIMPLLSHDREESEYQYVDTNDKSGIKTKVNVLRGWPTVIFCQAIDSSYKQRWPETQRRFVFVNPEMTTEKYGLAIDHSGKKHGMSHMLYEEEVISKNHKDIARGMILLLKEELLGMAYKSEMGSRDCIIPFYEGISNGIPFDDAKKMTLTDRLFDFCQMITYMNVNRRPRLVTKDPRVDPEEQEEIRIPISTFEDVRAAFDLTEFQMIQPHKYRWYVEVLIRAWNAKGEDPDSKTDSKNEMKRESRKTLSLTEIIEADKIFTNSKKAKTGKAITKEYIEPLQFNGYIEQVDSQIDKRMKKFYPILIDQSETGGFGEAKDETGKTRRMFVVIDDKKYPTKDVLIKAINAEIKVRVDKNLDVKINDYKAVFDDLKPFGNGDELTLDQLVEKYHSDPTETFQKLSDVKAQKEEKKIDEITGEEVKDDRTDFQKMKHIFLNLSEAEKKSNAKSANKTDPDGPMGDKNFYEGQ